jgi:hypothetical protein
MKFKIEVLDIEMRIRKYSIEADNLDEAFEILNEGISFSYMSMTGQSEI